MEAKNLKTGNLVEWHDKNEHKKWELCQIIFIQRVQALN